MLDYKKKQSVILKSSKALVDWLLTLNTNNRNVKKSHVEWLTKAIENGEFIFTGQGISVSKDGKLIDGQHRLIALREAGYPHVDLMVVTGLEEEAMIYVDQHAKRSSADMLKIVVNKNVTSYMAAVVNFHIKLNEGKDGFYFTNGKASLESIVEATEEYGDVIAEIIEASGKFRKAGALCGYLHYALKYNKDAALRFASEVSLGEGLKRHDPAYRLREAWLTRKSAGGSAGLADYMLCVSACVADANKTDLQSLRPSSNWKGLPKGFGRVSIKKAS